MAADTKKVSDNIENIYERRKAAVYSLALRYATHAINDFRKKQAGNNYWENRSTQAMKRMFTKGFIEGDTIGFLMAHGVEYGVYLELANNGLNQAIRPTMNKWAKLFIAAVRRLYGGDQTYAAKKEFFQGSDLSVSDYIDSNQD